MKHFSGTEQYDMGWWRRCQDDGRLTYGSLPGIEIDADTQSIPLQGTAPSSNGEDGGNSENEEDEKYGLFRNETAKKVWAQYTSVKSGKGLSRGVEDDDGEKEIPESTILQLARLDAWIMTVLKCMVVTEIRGGQSQKIYMDTFQEFLPIAMGQLSEALYDWVDEWEPEDLTAPTEADTMSMTDDIITSVERKERVFIKVYQACTPVYVPSGRRSYLAIRNEWFTKYVGDELGKIYDCYIAEFSENYSQLKKLSVPGGETYQGNRYERFADTPPPPPPVNSSVTGGDSDI